MRFFFVALVFTYSASPAHAQEDGGRQTRPYDPGSLNAFEAHSVRDPFGLIAESRRELGEADSEAADAAEYLRQKALQYVENRIRTLEEEGRLLELEGFRDQVKKGNCKYEDEPEIGVAKVNVVDGDRVVKISLNPDAFPNASRTVFLIYDLQNLRPDPKRVEIILAALKAAGDASEVELHDFVKRDGEYDYEKIDAFIVEAAERNGLDEAEIRSYLNSGSRQLKSYIASLMLESDVQAIGMDGERAIQAFFGESPNVFHKPFRFLRTWWNSVKAPITAGSVFIGVVCGGFQGYMTYEMQKAATFYMPGEALEAMGTGADPSLTIPIVAAVWSLSYGITLGAVNAFYRNFVYHGTPLRRLLKLSLFGEVFALVYKLITKPRELATFAGWVHLQTNVFLNQYMKDDAYRIARYREYRKLNTGGFKIPLPLPEAVRRLHPNLFSRVIPREIVIKSADVETQVSYHILWALKHANLIHLVKTAVLPIAVVGARLCSYAYIYFDRIRLKRKFRRHPSNELQRDLDLNERTLKELHESWLDVIYIPVDMWRNLKLIRQNHRDSRRLRSQMRGSGAAGPSCAGKFGGLNRQPGMPRIE